MVTVQVTEIPVELMCEATKVADVHQIMILDRKKHGIGRGEPDVAVVSPLGMKQMMHRSEVAASFVTMRGKKLKISSLRYDVKYTVMKLERQGVYAFKVPRSTSTRLVMSNGDVAKPGGYLVGVVDENNIVDMSNANWVASKFFRKMFKVEKLPRLSSISKDLGKNYVFESKVEADVEVKESEHTEKIFNGSGAETVAKEKVAKDTPLVERAKELGRQNANKPADDTKKVLEESRAVVLARITKFGSSETIGFVVRFCGKEEKMNIAKVKKLCSMHIVENMKLVDRDGTKYLAGVGIRIDELPVLCI